MRRHGVRVKASRSHAAYRLHQAQAVNIATPKRHRVAEHVGKGLRLHRENHYQRGPGKRHIAAYPMRRAGIAGERGKEQVEVCGAGLGVSRAHELPRVGLGGNQSNLFAVAGEQIADGFGCRGRGDEFRRGEGGQVFQFGGEVEGVAFELAHFRAFGALELGA